MRNIIEERSGNRSTGAVNFNPLIVDEARKWLGAPSHPYQGADAGQSPEGFDCSGFTRFILLQTGVPLPAEVRHCNEFFDRFGVPIHNHQPGDLIFFSRNGMFPTHIGIVSGEDTYIHAPGKRNSVVRESLWTEKHISSNGEVVLYLRDPIGFKRVAMQEGRWYRVQ